MAGMAAGVVVIVVAIVVTRIVNFTPYQSHPRSEFGSQEAILLQLRIKSEEGAPSSLFCYISYRFILAASSTNINFTQVYARKGCVVWS